MDKKDNKKERFELTELTLVCINGDIKRGYIAGMQVAYTDEGEKVLYADLKIKKGRVISQGPDREILTAKLDVMATLTEENRILEQPAETLTIIGLPSVMN